MESPGELWWQTDPTIRELTRTAMADLQRAIDESEPTDPDQSNNEPDPVVEEFYSGARVRALVTARNGLARARAEYDDAVLNARAAGLSWGEIGAVLGVSKQQLHRRFRGRG